MAEKNTRKKSTRKRKSSKKKQLRLFLLETYIGGLFAYVKQVKKNVFVCEEVFTIKNGARLPLSLDGGDVHLFKDKILFYQDLTGSDSAKFIESLPDINDIMAKYKEDVKQGKIAYMSNKDSDSLN